MFEDVLQVDPDAEETALIAQIGDLETMKAAAAAAQARATAQLVAKRRAAEAARGVPAAKRGRGLASEIALARRDSPACGGRHLGFATALVHEMPHTLAALESGVLSEWRATLIVRESACLDVDDRARLDAELCADPTRLEGKGDKRIAADAKAIAYRLDPHAVVDRAVRAESERTVTVRPAPDCMAYVTALLPMTQGVAVYAAVKRAADTCFDGRSRGQVMADTLVERVTGRPAEVPTPIAVNLVISDDTLLGGGYRAGAPHRIRARTRSGGPQARPNRRLRPSIQSHPAQALQTPGLRRRSWPWNPGHGASHAGWPRSSPPATTRAPPRTAMPRSATSITPPRRPAADPPPPTTAAAPATPATTRKKPAAG